MPEYESEIAKLPPHLLNQEARWLSRAAWLIERAREDPNTFIELCGRIEGGRVVGWQNPVHRAWQDHLTRGGPSGFAQVLCGVAMAKSSQIHRWRVLWEIGKNPNIRVGLVGATTELPKNFLAGIKADIESNPWVRAVFPHLKRGTRQNQRTWNTEAIHVERSDIAIDPTIQVIGLGSKPLGKRLDLVVFDDVLNTENTLTDYMRQRVWTFCNDEVISRSAPGVPFRAWWLGHPWTEADAAVWFAQLPGCRVLRHGSRTQVLEDGTFITSADRRFREDLPWQSLIPTLWSKEKLEAKYKALKKAARHMLDCRTKASGAGGFNPEMIANALTRGRGQAWASRWDPKDCPVYAGVDVGGEDEGDDEWAIVIACVYRDGMRRILEIQTGHWTGPEARDRIVDVYRRFGCVFAVESNQSQRLVREFTQETNVIPIKDSFMGLNKHGRFGVTSLELELGPSLAECKWMWPCPDDVFAPLHPGLAKLVDGCVTYDANSHCADTLSAWWHCREAMRLDGY